MKTAYIIATCFGIALGFAAFLASNLWYFGVGIGVAALSVLDGFVAPAYLRYGDLSRRRHECYLFIHSYLVTLSVCMSLEKAYDSASSPMGKEFHLLDATLATMEAKEKTEYLANYFDLDLYRLFLSVLRLFLDRGGDILKLSNELTAEASRIEETEQGYQKHSLRKATGYFFLWGTAIVIVVFLRFGLSSFFSTLQTSWTYLGALVAFFAFLLASVMVFAKFHTGVPLFKTKWG